MKVGLLSHRGGNIGHDMMALGMETIARQAFGDGVEIEHLEQHAPLSHYPRWQPMRYIKNIPAARWGRLKRAMTSEGLHQLTWKTTKRLGWDLAMACGGPNIVPGISNTPEMKMMFHLLPGSLAHQGIPVLDLAVGSCYPLERIPDALDAADARFHKRSFSYCRESTVRDRLAKKLWTQLGRSVEIIPCGAMATGRYFRKKSDEARVAESDKFIGINFQEKGANDDWDQHVDTVKWRATVRDLCKRLAKRHKLGFICHSEKEERLAADIDHTWPRYHPRSLDDYAQVIAHVKTALVCRVHSAIPLAGTGIASIVIGTDSRLWAVEEMGLKTIYVKDAEADGLESSLEGLLKIRRAEEERLIHVREMTITKYTDVMKRNVAH